MKYKYAFLLLFSSFLIKTVISIDVIPKYGKKTTYDSSIFLDVSGFNKDEKIYISITTDNYYYNNHYYGSSYSLRYAFYERNTGGNFIATSSVSYSSSSSVNSRDTYNYRIKKTSDNAKYLYLQYDGFHLPVTIENTENDATTTLIIVVVIVSVIFVAVIIVIIVCCCRRRRAAAMTPVVYPSTSAYGLSPYGVQPVVPVMQPVVQPVVQQVASVQPYGTGYPQQNPNYNNYNYKPDPNVQYGQIPQNQPESDYRINNNNNIKYEKPM